MVTVSCLFPGTVPPPASLLEPADCDLVTVPGQLLWHTHLCEVCGSSWTHIAPTPMTQATNRKIHTCTKCGTMSYKFIPIDQKNGFFDMEVPVLWIGAAVL